MAEAAEEGVQREAGEDKVQGNGGGRGGRGGSRSGRGGGG